MLFDTHAHFDDKKFDEDRDALLSSMKANGVGYIVNASYNVNSVRVAISLAEKYDFVYATAGIHPNNVDMRDKESFAEIKRLAAHPRVRAIGEIGLDYYWDKVDPASMSFPVISLSLQKNRHTRGCF